ncbi:hypothetical protein [Microbacterium sp. NIBRBAC000506063]|uniref:hypothetical protein n=1 Tax=Microbacterium sp. NIBRBAC000506063 TaxID=2734618 RepID=UPI001CB71C23|nr:hypothetical protein [Microbacterium sp. NIBRBAC000506063]
MTETMVTFPQGAVAGVGTVMRVEGDIVVVDRTPFHPVDHTWPDQPGDSGFLVHGEERVAVVEAVMAAVSDDGEFAVGAAIPVKRGAEGWTWLVGHRVSDAGAHWLAPGTDVELAVDAERRAALSRGHTACHLASLALDAALADLWRKDPGTDPLGAPDFEGRANQTSFIHEDGAVDEYRLGKSLRKAGFDTEGLAASLGSVRRVSTRSWPRGSPRAARAASRQTVRGSPIGGAGGVRCPRARRSSPAEGRTWTRSPRSRRSR